MRVLIIDSYGYSLDMATRMQEYGNTVRVFMPPLKNGEKNTNGDGYITKVPEWEPQVEWSDLIVNTSNRKYLKRLDTLRNDGYPIWGPAEEAAKWEFDRLEGQFVLHDSGIHVLEFEEFKTFDEGINYVKKNPGRYACKPSADTEDKALCHVGKCESGKDLVFMLEHWRDSGMKRYPYILQPFVKGVEMAVSGYFGLNGFVGPWFHNFEFKKLMNGDIGPNTGEQGNVTYCTEVSKLADMVLTPLTPRLLRMKYTGSIDVSVIITKGGTVNPLEFTSRCSWPGEWINNTLIKGDPAQWRLDAIQGRNTIKFKDSVAVGVLLTQPPFPYDALGKQDSLTGYPFWGSDVLRERCQLIEMKKGKGLDEMMKPVDMPVSTGCELALITGHGQAIGKAVEQAYSNIGRVEYPNNIMYRTDIGKRLESQLSELKRLGFVDDDIKY